MRAILIAVVAIGLAGCGGMPHYTGSANYVWAAPDNVTPEQATRDQTECQHLTMTSAPAPFFPGFADAEWTDFYVRCLESRGYTRVPLNKT